MSDHIGPAQSPAGGQFAAYEDELRAAEKKVAGEIDPGARALMVAVGVLVAMMSLVLPHTGSASGLEVLANAPDAANAHLNVTSRIFVYMLLIFGVGGSALALLTRRWAVAWSRCQAPAVTCVAGMLAWWSRHSGRRGGAPVGGRHRAGARGDRGIVACVPLGPDRGRAAPIIWRWREERRREAAERDELARLLQTRPIHDTGNDPDEQHRLRNNNGPRQIAGGRWSLPGEIAR